MAHKITRRDLKKAQEKLQQAREQGADLKRIIFLEATVGTYEGILAGRIH